MVKWLPDQRFIYDLKIVDDAKFLEAINAVLVEHDQNIKKYRHDILNKLKN